MGSNALNKNSFVSSHLNLAMGVGDAESWDAEVTASDDYTAWGSTPQLPTEITIYHESRPWEPAKVMNGHVKF